MYMDKKISKIIIVSVIVLIIFSCNNFLAGGTIVSDYAGESVLYFISPLGRSEYTNLGTTDVKGVKLNLITLNSKILFIDIAENIYSYPESLLPYKTERTTSGFLSKEYRTEEYDQENFSVVIKKFKGKKLVKQQIIKTDRPIQNVNLLLFYLRTNPDLKIGWHFTTKVVNELKLLEVELTLLSIDEITVPAGTFQAYHFKSVPDNFEIWIDKNNPRIPLKIKLKGIISCTALMKQSSLHNDLNQK